MSMARYGMAAAMYADQIYLIGGENEQGVVNLNEQYDPENDQWITMMPKPQAVTDVQSAVIGGKIYIPGGRLPSASMSDILEIYDPREDSWERGARLPVPLSAYALVAFEGKLYVFGGWDGKRYREEVYAFDPERNSWSVKTPMLIARAHSGAVVSNGKIYVMGGYDGKDILTANHLYSPEEDNDGHSPWQTLNPLPQGRYAMGIANIADRIYLVGGKGVSGQPLPDLEYQIETNVWRQKQDTPFRDWSDLRLVTFGSRIFSYGGKKADSPVANQMVYQPFYTVLFPIVQ
jgi:N-acetylneuraminic acid mutarotase